MKPSLSSLLALLVASLLLLAPAADAAWPGGNGAIAFSRNPANGRAGGDIWIQERSGAQRALTSARAANDGEPTYSPDGRMIAFSRYAGGDFDLWVMNADGSHKRQVTRSDNRVSEEEPAFFPSGRSIAFLQQGGAGAGNVYSIRTDGTHLKLLAEDAKSPVVSPDGRWLAFWRYPGDEGLRLKNLRTGAERRLPSGPAHEPDFSPDGRRLVFVGARPCGRGGGMRRSLLTIGLHARRSRMLLNSCGRSYVPLAPAFSPRGNRVVFTRLDTPRGSDGVRLAMVDRFGNIVGGAPRHRAGTLEIWSSWQPLR